MNLLHVNVVVPAFMVKKNDSSYFVQLLNNIGAKKVQVGSMVFWDTVPKVITETRSNNYYLAGLEGNYKFLLENDPVLSEHSDDLEVVFRNEHAGKESVNDLNIDSVMEFIDALYGRSAKFYIDTENETGIKMKVEELKETIADLNNKGLLGAFAKFEIVNKAITSYRFNGIFLYNVKEKDVTVVDNKTGQEFVKKRTIVHLNKFDENKFNGKKLIVKYTWFNFSSYFRTGQHAIIELDDTKIDFDNLDDRNKTVFGSNVEFIATSRINSSRNYGVNIFGIVETGTSGLMYVSSDTGEDDKEQFEFKSKLVIDPKYKNGVKIEKV